MADRTLGEHISDALVGLTNLIIKTKDDKEREKLTRQHKQLATKLQSLIDETVGAMTEEYENAIAALEGANAALKQAKKDIAAIAEAIKKIAKAISAVSKLAAML